MRVVDWPEGKKKAANIAANKHGGEFDFPVLKDIIIEIDDGSIDIELTGHDKDELDNMFEVTSEEKTSKTCPECGCEL